MTAFEEIEIAWEAQEQNKVKISKIQDAFNAIQKAYDNDLTQIVVELPSDNHSRQSIIDYVESNSFTVDDFGFDLDVIILRLSDKSPVFMANETIRETIREASKRGKMMIRVQFDDDNTTEFELLADGYQILPGQDNTNILSWADSWKENPDFTGKGN